MGIQRYYFPFLHSKILNFSFMGNGKHARFKLLGGGNLKFVIWNDAEKMSRLISIRGKNQWIYGDIWKQIIFKVNPTFNL
jgi:hypothetical protein